MLELANTQHTIALDAEHLKMAMHRGFKAVLQTSGKENIFLNVSSSPPHIKLKGRESDAAKVLQILAFAYNNPSDQREKLADDSTKDCCVCWTEATQAVAPPCGHTYCLECLMHQCASATDGQLPVCCFGAACTCGKAIPLPDLESLLYHDQFQRLLDGSFNSSIRSKPLEYQYCPRPDCPNIYQLTKDEGNIATRRSCLSSICTTCKVSSHEGVSCAEYQYLISEGAEEFKQWKKDNDVRDCPKCGTGIEKISGCNHMECDACKSHICCFCMMTFEKGEDTYEYMSTKHGNYYERDIWDPEDEA